MMTIDLPTPPPMYTATITHTPAYIENEAQETPLQLVSKADTRFRRAPKRFYIEMDAHSQDAQGRISCTPGSSFTGAVHLELGAPLSALHLRLIFIAQETISTGKSTSQSQNMFAIQTVLWGKNKNQEDDQQWPLLDAGEHSFPFVVQLPLVNYSPSFASDLASTKMYVFAAVERPGMLPFHTQQRHVFYVPTILPPPCFHYPPWSHCFAIKNASSLVNLVASVDQRVVILNGNTTSNHACVPLRLEAVPASPTVSLPASISISACVKRTVTIAHVTKANEESTIISSKTLNWHPKAQRVIDFFATIPLLDESASASTSSGNSAKTIADASTALTLPSIEYSTMFNIRYTMELSVKIKSASGLLTAHREHVSIPIFVANDVSPPKASPTTSLVPFTHKDAMQSNSMEFKPHFVSPSPTTAFLPPYDPDRPPAYDA
ncbi:hypothetical protein BC940DRAFT_370578 [Gongronella butleri]|nr:hypothetical protein BC940DRAFT_370578 [Gongronella butleri]